MSKNLYRDGQTRSGYITAMERVHDELSFTYRPMLAEDVEFTDDERRKLPPKKSVQFLAAQVTKHLTSWSEVDDAGKPCPIELATVLRLPHVLLTQSYLIIAGHLASDVRPGVERSGERDTSEADRIIAAASGRDLNGVEADEKNFAKA